MLIMLYCIKTRLVRTNNCLCSLMQEQKLTIIDSKNQTRRDILQGIQTRYIFNIFHKWPVFHDNQPCKHQCEGRDISVRREKQQTDLSLDLYREPIGKLMTRHITNIKHGTDTNIDFTQIRTWETVCYSSDYTHLAQITPKTNNYDPIRAVDCILLYGKFNGFFV